MAEIDRSVIHALCRGEEQAYALVIDELHVPVYRFLLRLSRDSGIAEDLTQETFIALWQGIGSFRGRSRFKTWVFGIAYRQFLRHKDKRIVETVELVESDLSDPSDLSELVEESQERARLRRAVYGLPDLYREVVCLVHFDGLSYRECAGVLGIPTGTVKSRMNGAFKLLRETLEEQDYEIRQTA
ncbi:MAG TPA: RNA polymerase sigma factor [Armatimonadota bacterium]|nr:RNA polymerase sigma factor [Armatimonadota bacterium]